MELVVDNDAGGAEEALRASFARMADNVLRFLADGSNGLDLDLMRDFLALHDQAEAATDDPRGVAFPIPDISGAVTTEPDKSTNTALRGALGMVAARLLHRGAVDSDAYRGAHREFAVGLAAILKLANKRGTAGDRLGNN